jgi:uncharacterized repeat protein (TIGR03803 family)
MRNGSKLLVWVVGLWFAIAAPVYGQGQIKELFGFPCPSNCPDGWSPDGGLVQASDGNFYGTASQGGDGGESQARGTIFRILASGEFKLLFTFATDGNGNFTNGSQPFAGLVEGIDGALYGTTATGGANDAGVIFKISKAGRFQVLHHFCSQPGCADGSTPFALLALGNDGKLYGTASAGGGSGAGTIFRITDAGTFTVLHTLNGSSDGSQPMGGLMQATDGNFYGATNTETDNLAANLVRVTPGGDFAVVAPLPFLGNLQGQLLQGVNGKLYGGIQYDALFDVSAADGVQLLLALDTEEDGDSPLQAGLMQGSDGNLWGTSAGEGFGNYGVVYAITPDGQFVKNFAFNCSNGGGGESASLQGSDGKLYGTTAGCGTDANGQRAFGEVYSLDAGLQPPLAGIAELSPKSGSVGAKVVLRGEHFIGTTAVSFNGTAARFRVVNTKFVVAEVPSGATTGPISVTNPGGVTKSRQVFTVK